MTNEHTSIPSPGKITTPSIQFTIFLRNLSEGKCSREAWLEQAVAHYSDKNIDIVRFDLASQSYALEFDPAKVQPTDHITLIAADLLKRLESE